MRSRIAPAFLFQDIKRLKTLVLLRLMRSRIAPAFLFQEGLKRLKTIQCITFDALPSRSRFFIRRHIKTFENHCFYSV